MENLNRIINAIDDYLDQKQQKITTPVEINPYLETRGLLNDSPSRPGLPIRKLLRKGAIPHAYQVGAYWQIPHSQKSLKHSKSSPNSENNQRIHSINLSKMSFYDFKDLDEHTLNQTGIYFIKLKNNSKLPPTYQEILDKREHRIIYIGKAQSQTLRSRLNQEIFHTNPGTFFRSIGAVLNFLPIPGHLSNKRNQKNYRFSKSDTNAISNWLIKNTEFSILGMQGNFSFENDLIKKYCPLLNEKGNPKRLWELKSDREKCREIAIGVNTAQKNQD